MPYYIGDIYSNREGIRDVFLEKCSENFDVDIKYEACSTRDSLLFLLTNEKDSHDFRYAHISSFPGGCAWIVLHGLSYHKDEFNLQLEFAKFMAKFLQYNGILISHIRGHMKEKIKDAGFTRILEEHNLHSGNDVVMYYLSLNENKED